MEIYVVADTHFNHKNIITYCNRPFGDIETMNHFLIDKWNKKVSNNDLVIHLGDFGFGDKEKIANICNTLNGQKILLYGNHDLKHGKNFWLDCGFKAVYKDKQKSLNEIVGQTFIDNAKDIILSHYPINVKENQLNIHGHIHNAKLDTKQFKEENHICVSVEIINYEPVNLYKLVNEWRDSYERRTS